jgi:hypothetical protein
MTIVLTVTELCCRGWAENQPQPFLALARSVRVYRLVGPGRLWLVLIALSQAGL